MSRPPAVEHPPRATAPPVLLDGATLTPEAVAAIARDGAPAELAPEAHARNDRARAAIVALLARGDDLYGVTTGVGALRAYRVPKNNREQYSLSLLRSHACGAGRPLSVHLVRAAMATRANQIGAGGAGIARELLDVLVSALNAGLTPFTRELGSLGTGDLTNLADIGLALLGEGQVWREDQLIDAGTALAAAGLGPALAQSAALIAARVSALLDTSLTGLQPFLARRPGPESGALVLEYTAHAAVAEVRSLVTPGAAQTVSVSRGVESHSSLAPIAARRAHQTLDALRVAVATELVVAVRALRLAGQEPVGAGTRPLWQAAIARLNPDLSDRPLHPDVEAARALLEAWEPGWPLTSAAPAGLAAPPQRSAEPHGAPLAPE